MASELKDKFIEAASKYQDRTASEENTILLQEHLGSAFFLNQIEMRVLPLVLKLKYLFLKTSETKKCTLQGFSINSMNIFSI